MLSSRWGGALEAAVSHSFSSMDESGCRSLARYGDAGLQPGEYAKPVGAAFSRLKYSATLLGVIGFIVTGNQILESSRVRRRRIHLPRATAMISHLREPLTRTPGSALTAVQYSLLKRAAVPPAHRRPRIEDTPPTRDPSTLKRIRRRSPARRSVAPQVYTRGTGNGHGIMKTPFRRRSRGTWIGEQSERCSGRVLPPSSSARPLSGHGSATT